MFSCSGRAGLKIEQKTESINKASSRASKKKLREDPDGNPKWRRVSRYRDNGKKRSRSSRRQGVDSVER